MRLSEGTRLGRYEIGALIGAGGMGEVYRARDPTLRRDVAVKVVAAADGDSDERLRRFEKEARAAAELEHSNIIAVHDVGVDAGVAYIVTELLDGGTLAEALRPGPLARARAIQIAVQIARGVGAAHQHGIVHRDLKPSNVFLCRDGRVKILDFGLATHLTAATPGGNDPTLTETGAILGTPAYMSPEQVRGKRADHRADLFALGAIVYEMLSGRRPFAGDSSVELAHAILTRDPDPLDDPALDAVVRLCLAKDPAARLSSAEDLALVLASLPPPREAAPPPRRSRRLWAVAIPGGLAAAVAVGALVSSSREVAPGPRYTRITYGHQWAGPARFAPDGRTVIYMAGDRANHRVFASTPGRPEARPLTEPHTSLVAVSATGDMLLQVDAPDGKTVMARAALAGGVPRVVYDDVEDADFSPDGSELAIVRRVAGLFRLEFPTGRVLFTTPFRIGGPRISPRGDQVAFTLHESPSAVEDHGAWNRTGTVGVVGKDGKRRTLGAPWRYVVNPVWSADGREVLVSGRREGSAGIHALGLDGHERTVLELPAWIVLMDVARDGRALLQVWALPLGIAAKVPGSGAEVELGWYDQSLVADLSPDGRLLLFAEVGESSQERSETYVRRTDGSPAVDLGPGTPLALSPDGAWALVGPAEGSESSLALVPTGAGDRRSLPAGRIEHYAEAYFFPDGERIAVRAREAGGRMRVWVQDIAGGDPRPISDEGIAWLMRPAAKGDAVPACRRDGSCALYPTAGGEHRPLPASRPGDRLLQVAPDGQSLVVIRPDGTRGWLVSDETALWKIDVATGQERLLHELDHCRRETCDPVSLRLTPDASSYAYTYGVIESMIVLVEGLR